jgi:hypothetical protein
MNFFLQALQFITRSLGSEFGFTKYAATLITLSGGHVIDTYGNDVTGKATISGGPTSTVAPVGSASSSSSISFVPRLFALTIMMHFF